MKALTVWRLSSVARGWAALVMLALSSFTVTACAAGYASTTHNVPMARLERLVEGNNRLEVAGETIDVAAMRSFYRARDYAPVWLGTDERLNRRGRVLLRYLRDADTQGLVPAHYRIKEVEALTRPRPADPGALELLLSHELIHYATDLGSGRLEPRLVESSLAVFSRAILGPEVLDAAARARDIGSHLDSLVPASDEYRKLRDALAGLRKMARGAPWPIVPAGPSLKPGMSDPRVVVLRERLAESGDLAQPGEGPLFDEALAAAVRRFQARHGLAADGAVGEATLAALNVPLADKIEQVVLNMERLRWLPHDLGDDYVKVNIAAFDLAVVHKGATALSMRVVVGRTYRQTPVFASRIERVELNPYWNVPVSIARKDILPHILADPNYLGGHNFEVFTSWGPDAKKVDPRSVDWRNVAARGFPYKLRQKPGPENALGRFRFFFPNPFDVYLHDTPSRELFERETRTFSSGCIRLEKARALALYLLNDDPAWTPEAVDEGVQSGVNQSIPLARSVPVVVNYATAWVDDEGVLQFRPDIYGRDATLAGAFRTKEEKRAPARM